MYRCILHHLAQHCFTHNTHSSNWSTSPSSHPHVPVSVVYTSLTVTATRSPYAPVRITAVYAASFDLFARVLSVCALTVTMETIH